jgi:hypothetical protein
VIPEQVRAAVRNDYRSGAYNQRELAAEYGLTRQTVGRFVADLPTVVSVPSRSQREPKGPPLPPLKLPTYRWPTEAHLIARACPHCGSTFSEVDPPCGMYPSGAVSCLTCSRQRAWLVGS